MKTCIKCNKTYQKVAVSFRKYGRNDDGYDNICKKCRNGGTFDPVITKEWPKDENGRWLNYWHILEKDIILRNE